MRLLKKMKMMFQLTLMVNKDQIQIVRIENLFIENLKYMQVFLPLHLRKK